MYIDTLCFPRFGQDYALADGEKAANHDYALTVVLTLLIYAINKLVPYMGLEDKKAAAKKNLRAQAQLGL